MKVAFVYDRVNKYGGAERVLETFHEIWPEAPLFTSVYDQKGATWAKNWDIHASFLQKIPFARKNHEIFPLIMPLVFESFNFENYDIVISITSESAKGIITSPKTLHICYCLTPTRYLWSGYSQYFKNKIIKFIAAPFINYLKKWDIVASQRPDKYIAISNTVKERIKKYYGRESEVVYPPVNIEMFKIKNQKSKIKTITKSSKFFLVVSRLVKYKKVDLVIKVFNKLKYNLKIIGTGSEMDKLKKIANSNIEFLGQLSDEELLKYYQNCIGFIFPQEEDFGIACLEAQACGKPVIAYNKGGSLETVINKKTGIFFEKQDENSLLLAINNFLNYNYLESDCRRQAENFNIDKFKNKFKNCIIKEWKKHLSNISTH